MPSITSWLGIHASHTILAWHTVIHTILASVVSVLPLHGFRIINTVIVCMACLASTSPYFDYKYDTKQVSIFFISDALCLYGVFIMVHLCLV